MEFMNEKFSYKTALDYAKERNYQEIVNLLTNGPILTKSEIPDDYELLKQKVESLTIINSQHKEQIAQLKTENNNLKDEIAKFKKKEIPTIQENQQTTSFKVFDEEEIQNFEKLEDIGYGGNGKVTKVAAKKIYAMKEMSISNPSIENFRNFIKEYELMNLLHHPNVLEAIGIFLSSQNIPPCILLEFCPMNLAKAIEDKIFSNEELVKVIYQIAEGMKYIHFMKIIHRDLKPTNILIASDGTVKICDFGISKLMTLDGLTMTRGLGTQNFAAPEIINDEDHYDEKVDVYSFGVLVFFILSQGKLPKIKIFDIAKGKKAEIPSSFTQFAKKLINDCWNLEAKDRPSFKEIVDDMEKCHYNLLPLDNYEIKSVEAFVKQHKAKLPSY